MRLNRVVITGLGAVTPLGNDVATTWQSLIEGKSGAGMITHFDASKFKTQFACEVKNFDASSLLDRKELRKLDLFSQYALYAAHEAVEDSELDFGEEDPTMMGVVWGSGMGGVRAFEEDMSEFALSDGTPRFNPFLIPKVITNIAAGHISIMYGLRGVNITTTSACASSAHAIAVAFDSIRMGRAQVVIAGGSEAPIVPVGVDGFNSMHALSTRNDSPATASRPFSLSRDGFVLGEGSACLVLEDLRHAKARGAKIYAELVGAGFSADAYHITAPDPAGHGAETVMRFALEDARLKPEKIDYINTHGTSTPIGDVAEARAICSLFGEKVEQVSISSTKSMTGHMLGAAGAMEALVCVLSTVNDIVPPTINHEEGDIDEQFPEQLDFTFNQARHRVVNYALSNSFGFGGHNATLIFKKWIH